MEEARAEAKTSQEILAAARKEAESERERFKKITQELKKKIDRFQGHCCIAAYCILADLGPDLHSSA